MRVLFNTVVLIAVLAMPRMSAAEPPAATAPAMSPDPLAYVSPSRPFATTHTSVDLDIDVAKQTIAGGVTHTIRSLRGGLSDVSLNCVDLVIESIDVDGAKATYDYPVTSDQSTSWLNGTTQESADDRLVIHLPKPLARNATAKVTIKYHGAPKIGLYWIQPEKGLPEHRYEVWSQGEGEDNRRWIPCNDYPNDKATYEGRFRVAKGYTAISNGALVDRKDTGDKTEFYYKLDQPQASYLIMVAVAQYKILEQKWHDVPVEYVVPPNTDDKTILRGYGLTPDMIDYFSKETGIDYPYAKYAQISVQDYIYGGMENTTAVVMNMRTLYDERTEPTRTEQNLVAHELAHMWWGDMLTCREWSHLWLNEGFATYYCYLYKEHHDGEDAFQYQMRSAHNDVLAADAKDPRPIVTDFYNRKDALNNANVYVKGASFLHMLRYQLGDSLYREVIHTYGTKFKFQCVETQDLMRVVKDVTGENLDWMFEQWVFLAGHPDFKVTKSYDDDTHVLRVGVEQTQKTGGLVPIFRVPADIDITWDGGHTTQRVTIEQQKETFYFNVPKEPQMVLFDQDDWILKTLDFAKKTSESIHELQHAPYMARVRAAEALATKGSDEETVPALKAVLLADGQYGLRRECALALGKISNDAALNALEEGLKAKDGLVRLACVEAMGNFYRDTDAAATLEKSVNNDFAWGVRAEALNSLGKIKTDNASNVCAAALAQESDHNAVRIAALNALADLKATASMDRIRKYMTPGNPRVCRNAAITAYSKLAKELVKDADRRSASDVIAQSLTDWHLRTREAAIEGLAVVADPSALPSLQRVASNDPVAEVRDRARKASDRVTAQLAAAKGSTDQAATIEELTRRVRTLEQQADQARQDAAAKSKRE
jgi:aminopeptidase N